MTPSFAVHPSSHYQRISTKLQKGHRDFEAAERSAVANHNTKKLEGVPSGEGQYRLALGRWRFRYDIIGQVVLLAYCGLRRDSTY